MAVIPGKATSSPDGINFPQWSTGSTNVISQTGQQVRRVTVNDDISVRDINDLRTLVEALSQHTHFYEDDKGSC